ncbi:MAG: hypothetical protein K9L88_14765 [Chromatiaceae bacterium]|nr:hypothetical protein [Chromatiaceae bacterium]
MKTLLEGVEVFHTRVDEILHESESEDTAALETVPPKADESVLEAPALSTKASSENEGSRSILTLRKKVSTTKAIWQATIDTEAEALPRIEVADEPRLSREATELVVPSPAVRLVGTSGVARIPEA